MPTIAAHKGLSTTLGYSVALSRARPTSDRRRVLHRDVRFLVYHSGFEADVAEGPYDTPHPRPRRQPARHQHARRRHRAEPERVRRARHDVVVAARAPRGGRARARQAAASTSARTTCSGAPTPCSTDRRRARSRRSGPSQISEQFQEQFGYPALTDEIKRKVLGLNALRLHDVDPVTVPCAFTREDLERLRLALPVAVERRGPRTHGRAPGLRRTARACRAARRRELFELLRFMPARSPRLTNFRAILRLASSIISSPNITAPRRSPSVVAFS